MHRHGNMWIRSNIAAVCGALITFFALSASHSATAASHRFDKPGWSSRGKCHKLLLTERSTPLEVLSAHVQVRPDIIKSLLNTLEQLPFWPDMDGIDIHGSRAHKLWGFNYDLDLGPLPAVSGHNLNQWYMSESFTRLVSDFEKTHGIRLDFSFFAYEMASLRQLLRDGDIPSQAALASALKPLENQTVHKGKTKALRETIPPRYYRAAEIHGFSPRFLSTGTVFILKRTSNNRELARQLREMGYAQIYFLCKEQTLCTH